MRKFYCVVATFMLLSFIVIAEIEIAQCASTNASINVPYSTNVPTLDEKWTTSTEWTDASEYELSSQNGWTAYIRTKQNSTHLFILTDFISDQSGTDSISQYDYCGIFFDTLNDGGNYPKSDDFLLSLYYYSNYSSNGMHTYLSQGTSMNTEGKNWVEIFMPQGFSLVRGFSSINDPYESNNDHRIYEASIPQEFLGNNSEIGFYIFVRDANTDSGLTGGTLLEFPVDAGGRSTRSDAMSDSIAPAPENWGKIVFVDTALPTPATTQTPTTSPTAIPTPMPSLPGLTSIIVIAVIIISIGIAIILLIGFKKHKLHMIL